MSKNLKTIFSDMNKRFINLRFKIYYSSIFTIKIWVVRKLTRILKLNRPVSYPFITGDDFRTLAQHIFDDISDFNPKKVCEGDTVFVRGDMLHSFFKHIHPKINKRYVLLSHNADNNITNEFARYPKNNIIHWFAQNLLVRDKNTTPLPIGLSNKRYQKEDIFIPLTSESNKKNMILASFDLESNPKRKNMKDKLSSIKTITKMAYMDKSSYYKVLSEFKFVISPEGNGIDCHRTWEAMLLKSIPILEKNIATEYFEKIRLPVLLVNSWDDLADMDENFLDKKYKELEPRFSSPAIFMDYWIKEIVKYKNI